MKVYSQPDQSETHQHKENRSKINTALTIPKQASKKMVYEEKHN